MAALIDAGEVGSHRAPAPISSTTSAMPGRFEATTGTPAAMRARIIRAAHERYNWERQVAVLAGIYRDLSSDGESAGAR